MKILITGAFGQLGKELLEIVKQGQSELGNISNLYKNSDIFTCDFNDFDISNLVDTKNYMNKIKPDVVINCAAMTNVDLCETEVSQAFKANGIGARNIALACEENKTKLVHISTDYVFNGESSNEYIEWDKTNPVTIYGKSKLLGEDYVREFCSRYFIVRTSWLYGKHGNNFVKTIYKIANEKDEIQVVNDQIGNPTNANDLAHHILKIALSEEYGLYHCTGKGICSWFDFAKTIVEYSNLKCIVTPCTSDEYVRAAKRPSYSALANVMLESTIGDEMREWQVAIKKFIEKGYHL